MSIARVRLTEMVTGGRRLGRNIHHDSRSKTRPAQRAPKIVSVKHNAVGLPFDQGDVGSCTAEALCGALNSAPNFQGTTLTQADAVKLYSLETQLEGQPYPPNDPGGSGLMVCKAAKQLGLISSYTHAFGVQHALEALVVRPVITGISWMSSFDTPNASGLVEITPDATVRGGHEIMADEIDVSNRRVGFMNSWGPSYGVGGRFYMSWATWDYLLQNYGDVVVPIK